MPGHWSRSMPPLLIALLLANGCASMHGGRSKVVLVESEPPGARILVGGKPAGVTPNFLTLKRRDAVITLDRDGFLPEEVEVPRSVADGVMGDIILGGFLFRAAGPYVLAATLGLDLVTGAAWELPEQVGATLEPDPAGVEPGPGRRPGNVAPDDGRKGP